MMRSRSAGAFARNSQGGQSAEDEEEYGAVGGQRRRVNFQSAKRDQVDNEKSCHSERRREWEEESESGDAKDRRKMEDTTISKSPRVKVIKRSILKMKVHYFVLILRLVSKLVYSYIYSLSTL